MKTLSVEIADTPHLLAQGLMFRKKLDNDAGMLFKFPDLTYASFFGKNTYIPLDVAFIDSSGTVVGINEVVPLSTKTIHSGLPCRYALEVNSGYFKKNDILVGTKVSISEKEQKVIFS